MDLINQMLLQKALSRLSDMLFIVKVEEESIFRYVFANQGIHKMIGITPEEIIGKTVGEFLQLTQDKKSIILEKYKEVVEQRHSIMYSDHFFSPDGNMIHVETILDPLINDEGELTHIVAIVRNITENVLIQDNLIELNNRLQIVEQHYQSIIENNNDAVWFTNTENKLVHANQLLRSMLSVSSDIELRKLRETTLNMYEPEELEKIRNHHRLVLQGEPQEYESYWMRQDGVRLDVQVKTVPVVMNNEIIGYYAFATDITKHKLIEIELRDSEERYRKLMEHMPEGVIVHQNGKIVYANTTTYKVLQADDECSILGRNVLDFVHPDDHAQVIERIEKTQINLDTADSAEERFITLNGQVIDGEATAVPIMYNGNLATQVIVRDISERKTKERELMEVKSYLEVYWNHVSDAVFSIDYNGKILDVNPAYTRMFGFTTQDLKNHPIESIFTDESQPEQASNIEAMRKGQEIFNQQLVKKTNDGRVINLLASYKPVNQRNIMAIGMFKDITKEVEVQQSLAESEQRFRSLFDYHKDAVWSLDLKGNFISSNPAIEDVIGICSELLNQMNFIELEEILLTPLEEVKDNFEKVKKGQSVEYQISLLHAERDVVHIVVNNVPIYVDGEVVGVYGIGKDITKTIRAEEALRKSEESYRLIADNMQDLIVMYTVDGIVKYASPSYERVLGVNPIEYLGQDVASLIYEEDRPAATLKFIDAIQNKCPFTVEFRKIGGANERLLYFETQSTPIFDSNNVLEGFLGVSRNISERKEIEATLRESEVRYRLISDNSQDLIRLLNMNNEVIYASPSYLTVFGFTPEEIVNQDLLNEIHPEDLDVTKEMYKNVLATQEPQMSEYRCRHQKGDWIWLQTTATPTLNEQGVMQNLVLVSHNITERKKIENQLQHLAFHDPLTNLPNRRYFIKLVNNALDEAKNAGRKVAIMYLDLDKFKQINDNLGHDVGDEVLIQFSQRVKKCLRKTDIIARLGGDEFIILLPMTEKIHARMIARKIILAVQEPYTINEYTITATSSIGVSIYPLHGEKVEELINNADEALYYAKENGRNGVHFFNEEK